MTQMRSELLPRTFSELVLNSDRIVVGTCLQTTAVWDHGLIVTRVNLAIEENLKGPSTRTIEFSVPGGELDGIRMEAGDMPVVRKADRILVFLAKSELGGFFVYGAVQGKFDVVKDPTDGALVAANPLVTVTAPASTTVRNRMVVQGGKRIAAVPLNDTIRHVRDWMTQNLGK